MYIIFLIIAFSLIANCSNTLSNDYKDQSITVKYGEITVQLYKRCVIKSNGIEYIFKGNGTVPGLWFGLIDYKCDEDYGHLISKFECKECGMFCVYNEMVPGCKQKAVPLLVGIAIGLVVGILVMGILTYLIKKALGSLWYHAIKIAVMNKYKKKFTWLKRDMSINNKRAQRIQVKNHPMLSPKHQSRIEDKVEKLNNRIICIENNKTKTKYENKIPEYIELPSTSISASAPVYPNIKTTKVQMENEKMGKIGDKLIEEFKSNVEANLNAPVRVKKTVVANENRVNAAKTVLLGAAILSGIRPSECCDQTLYIKSDGRVCDMTECKSIRMYNFPLQTGQEVCFKDTEGEILSVSIENSYIAERYGLVYRTTDFEILTESYYSCRHAGECYAGNCPKGKIGEGFIHDVNNKNSLFGYDCMSDVTGCDTWCSYGTACIFFKWRINEIGDQMPVYIKSSSIWEVEVVIKYKGIKTVKYMNVNNPTVSLVNTDIKNIKELPMYVTSFTSENENRHNSVIIHKGTPYNFMASEINFPMRDLIGDYQIDLNNVTRTYDIENIACRVAGCKPECEAPEPKVKRFSRINKKQYEVGKYKMMNNKRTIEARYRTKALINMLIGNIDINNLHVIPAKCQIDMVMTYACDGCNIKPYVIFKPYKIVNQGVVPFESNCTFDSNYISCNPEEYKLTLLDGNKVCSMYLIPFNKTYTINFNYTFLGTLLPFETLMSRGQESDIIGAITKSESFWSGLVNTITGFTLLGLVSAVILRIVKIIGYVRVAKKNVEVA